MVKAKGGDKPPALRIPICSGYGEGIVELIDKIKSKNAGIGVVGPGYVGLPLVMEFCKAGFHVTGFDIDEKKVVLLKQGKSYIKHIDSSRVAKCLPQFLPTNDFARLSGMDCIVICVPTPLIKTVNRIWTMYLAQRKPLPDTSGRVS